MDGIKSITALELGELISQKKDFQLIDTREPYEHDAFNIGGTLIPLSDITKKFLQIEKEKPVVFYCHRGIRSQIAIQRLQQIFPFTNLINLTGGIVAWKKQFP